MKASKLKQIVGLLSPCLGDGEFIPALANIMFDEQGVFAFNDQVATRYNWEHGLGQFGVNGSKLKTLINGWGDKELDLTTVKENAQLRLAIRSGKSITKLPAYERSSFVSDNIKISNAIAGTITEPERLEEALASVHEKAERPVYKSITLAVKEGSNVIKAYATDGSTLIHSVVGTTVFSAQEDRTWIVPSLAIRQMLSIRDKDEKLKLQLGQGALLAKSGEALVMSKLILDTAPPNYDKPLEGDTIIKLAGGWRQSDFHEELETASIIFNQTERALCQFSIEDGVVQITAKNSDGDEHRGKVALKGLAKDKLLEFHCNPDLLLRAFEFKSLNDESPLILQDKAAIFGSTKSFLYGAAFMQVKQKESA